MATRPNAIVLSLETTDLEPIREELERLFRKPALAKIMEGAIKKAAEPVFQRLKSVTPLGPTGNLRRAVDKKFKAYQTSGNAVGFVGYRAAATDQSESAAGGRVRKGKDRARHQYWIERGNKKPRKVEKLSDTPYQRGSHTRTTRSGTVTQVAAHTVKGQGAVIASSFNSLGPFQFAGRGAGKVATPGYPQAFFKKGKKNQDAIMLPSPSGMFAPGGRDGRPPLATAWAETGTVAAEIMQRELQAAIATALDGLTRLGERGAA